MLLLVAIAALSPCGLREDKHVNGVHGSLEMQALKQKPEAALSMMGGLAEY